MLGVFDPGDHRFRLQVVGIVKWLKDVSYGDGNVSSPGCGGSMCDLQPISNYPVGLGFAHLARRYHPTDLRFRSRVAGVVEI